MPSPSQKTAKVFEPPAEYEYRPGTSMLFLASSAREGIEEHWQDVVIDSLAKEKVVIFNPCRERCTYKNKRSRLAMLTDQIRWESTYLDWSSSIILYFNPDTPTKFFSANIFKKSDDFSIGRAVSNARSKGGLTSGSATWLESRLMADSEKLIVCCPDNFERKDEIESVCQRFGVAVVSSLSDLVSCIKAQLKEANAVRSGKVTKTFISLIEDCGLHYERKRIRGNGYLDLGNLDAIPFGLRFENNGPVNLIMVDSLPKGTVFKNEGWVDLANAKTVHENCVFKNKGDVKLYNLETLASGVYFNNSKNVELGGLGELPADFRFKNGGSLTLGVQTVPKDFVFDNGGSVDLMDITNLPRGKFENSGDVILKNVTKMARYVEFKNDGDVDLQNLKKLPAKTIFRNQGDVFLQNVSTLPKGFQFENVGSLFLPPKLFKQVENNRKIQIKPVSFCTFSTIGKKGKSFEERYDSPNWSTIESLIKKLPSAPLSELCIIVEKKSSQANPAPISFDLYLSIMVDQKFWKTKRTYFLVTLDYAKNRTWGIVDTSKPVAEEILSILGGECLAHNTLNDLEPVVPMIKTFLDERSFVDSGPFKWVDYDDKKLQDRFKF